MMKNRSLFEKKKSGDFHCKKCPFITLKKGLGGESRARHVMGVHLKVSSKKPFSKFFSNSFVNFSSISTVAASNKLNSREFHNFNEVDFFTYPFPNSIKYHLENSDEDFQSFYKKEPKFEIKCPMCDFYVERNDNEPRKWSLVK